MRYVSTGWRSNAILSPLIFLAFGEYDMQIDCKECGGTAIIHSRKKLDIKVSQLYCSCKNPECGHTFVMDLCFSHSLSPSSRQTQNMVLDFLRALPDNERQLMLANI
jgi:hypothetical protein